MLHLWTLSHNTFAGSFVSQCFSPANLLKVETSCLLEAQLTLLPSPTFSSSPPGCDFASSSSKQNSTFVALFAGSVLMMMLLSSQNFCVALLAVRDS